MKKLVYTSAIMLAVAAASLLAQAPVAPMAGPGVDLKAGDKAPDFSLVGSDGKTHTLAEYKGKTVVLAWYPAAFTGGCTAECKSFHESGEAIKRFDVVYFMASVDDAAKNKSFAEQEQADFPLLSDPERTVALAYGVVTSPTGVAKRYTFYIGGDGTILFVDKMVKTATAGTDLAAKLAALGTKKK